MLLLKHSTAVLCAVFIITGAVSGEEVKKAVGERVSFRPDKLGSSVTSFTWKQINGVNVVKAIEWDVDDDGFSIPNPRFQVFTTLDNKTGQITITNLKVEHSGIYTIDINSKEQQQRFSLTVMERVPKPVINIEKSNDPDVYLRCGYNGTIIWKNSAGNTLKGTKTHNPGEFITVKNTRNPGNFYTCTLKNDVSEETSDPVYERDLFIEPVPKPNITIEKSGNPDVYLRCEYSETIIWKNSAGDTLKGTKNHNPGEFITVKNTRNPENFYTCTLKNAVSEETSDPVYERDLFIEPVPKPVITIEKSSNPDVAYLRCNYSGTIIWKNSAGDTLKGTKNPTPGEIITVTNTRNPENYYTCTLKNAVSEETSDRVYERNIFVIALSKESNPGLIAGIVIGVLLLIITIILIYLLVKLVHERVNKICPCIPNVFGPLDCLLKQEGEPKDSPPNSGTSEPLNETTSP